MKTMLSTIIVLLATSQTFAAPRAFRIFTSKQITANVDRFYDKNDAAFATIFCYEKSPQVMFVDSRVPDLDGKIFFFGSPAVCQQARVTAREMSKKCVTQLLLDTDTQGAVVTTSQCKR